MEHEGIFQQYLLWASAQASGRKCHNVVVAPCYWVPLEFLIHTCPLSASSNPTMTIQVLLHQHCVSWQVQLLSLCCGKLSLPVFPSVTSGLEAVVCSASSPLLLFQELLAFSGFFFFGFTRRYHGPLTCKFLTWGSGKWTFTLNFSKFAWSTAS